MIIIYSDIFNICKIKVNDTNYYLNDFVSNNSFKRLLLKNNDLLKELKEYSKYNKDNRIVRKLLKELDLI